MSSYDFKALIPFLQKFLRVRALCIGDVILDTFNHGAVDRISPERPVPIFTPGTTKHIPGGAANVARNLSALGAHCSLVGVVGNDDANKILSKLVKEDRNLSQHLITIENRRTSHKVRFTAAGQHIMRLDKESREPVEGKDANRIIDRINTLIPHHDILILSDYSKGLLTPPLLSHAISLAREHGVPVVVDPKSNDFSRYSGATLVTPNCIEAERATSISIHTDEDAVLAGTLLLSTSSLTAVLITRGAHGMSLIPAEGRPLHLTSSAVEVFDVVGAGDTVIATTACMLAAGSTLEEAAACANIAAGIVVSKPDTSVVAPDEIIDHLEYLAAGRQREGFPLILTKDDLLSYVASRRAEGKCIGFTNGVFDILHPGHVSLLRFARENCDILIVGINSDVSVQRLGKGPKRPINNQLDRATVLGAFGMVSATTIFDQDTPYELIKSIRPDVLIKGADYSVETIVGSSFVMSYGGRVRLAPLEEGKSSTAIIQKTLASFE